MVPLFSGGGEGREVCRRVYIYTHLPHVKLPPPKCANALPAAPYELRENGVVGAHVSGEGHPCYNTHSKIRALEGGGGRGAGGYFSQKTKALVGCG